MLSRSLILIAVFLVANVAHAAPWYTFQRSILPADGTENIGTSTAPWLEGWFGTLCLAGDCRSSWPVGGAGGSGNVATSTGETRGFLAYWTSTNGTPALLGKVATSSVTINAPLTSSGTAGAVVGGSGWTLDIANIKAADLDLTDITLADFTNDAGFLTTVDISANTNLGVTYPIVLTNDTLSLAFGTTTSNTWANTQTFTNSPVFTSLTGGLVASNASSDTIYNLATTTASCSGSVSCSSFDIIGASPVTITGSGGTSAYEIATSSTVAQSQLAYYTQASGRTTISGVATTTLAGTANQVSVSNSPVVVGSAGAVLTLPSHVIFPSSFQAASATTTNATSTNLEVTNLLTFNGVTASTWAAFCTTITGSADLCDGSDASGVGGSSAFEIATTSDIAVSQLAYISKTGGRTTLASAATTTLTLSGPFTTSATLGKLVGGSDSTLTWTGLATTSNLTQSNLLYSTGGAGVSGVATTSLTASTPLSLSQAISVLGASASALSIADAVADGATKGAASFTAADFNSSSGNISIDYTNGQAASASNKGFLTSADWSLFNNKIGSSSLSATFPLSYNSSTGAFTFGGLSTSTAAVQGNIPYFSGVNTFANVATTTLAVSGPITASASIGNLVGGANVTLNWAGLATTSAITQSHLLYSSGGAGVTSVATSSRTYSGPFTSSGTLGAQVGGTASVITWTGLATTSQPASSNLLVSNGGAGVYPVATSSLTLTSFPANLSGTLGALVGGTNSTWTYWGLATSAAIANTEVIYGTAANTVDSEAALTYNATDDRLTTTYASTTVLSGTSLCISTDCRTSWPTAGGSGVGTISTSTTPTQGGLPYWTSSGAWPETLGTVSTTTLSLSGPFTTSATLGKLVGGSDSTLTWTGLATTSNLTQSGLLYNTTGGNGVASVASTSLSISGPFTIANAIGVLTNGAVTYTGLATTSAITQGHVFYSSGGAGVTSVATSSLSLSGPFTPTTFGAFVGGSNATLGWYGLSTTSALSAGDVLFMSSASGVTSDGSNFEYNNSRDALGIGTSTPIWSLTVASSTAPQLTLADGSTSNTPWNFRSISGNLFISTSSPTTFATTTNAAVTIRGSTGFFGIGTTSPWRALSVVGDAIFKGNSAATSTIYINSSDAAKGGRIILKDVNGSTCTEVTSLAGVLSAKAVTCP